MYTNILKEEILEKVSKLLNKKYIFVSNDFPIEEIITALTIILENNFFTYRDTSWLHLVGMAMGITISGVIVMLFFDYRKIKTILPIFNK